MSSGKPLIYTTKEEFDSEVKQLADLQTHLVPLQAELVSLQNQLAAAETEMAKAQATYDRAWAENRGLSRNVSRWEGNVHTLKGLQTSNKSYQFYLERSRNPRLSATERYVSGETARRLKPAKGYEPEWVDTTLVLSQARLSYWQGEQQSVISRINLQKPTLTYLRDSTRGLRAAVRQQASLIANQSAEIDDVKDQISRKRIRGKNQLVAMHKRWKYQSPRGPGHSISIEAIATVVIGPGQRKEDVETELEAALDEHMKGTVGFDKLAALGEEALEETVLGFTSEFTNEKERAVQIEDEAWQHKIAGTQLRITDYIKRGEA